MKFLPTLLFLSNSKHISPTLSFFQQLVDSICQLILKTLDSQEKERNIHLLQEKATILQAKIFYFSVSDLYENHFSSLEVDLKSIKKFFEEQQFEQFPHRSKVMIMISDTIFIVHHLCYYFLFCDTVQKIYKIIKNRNNSITIDTSRNVIPRPIRIKPIIEDIDESHFTNGKQILTSFISILSPTEEDIMKFKTELQNWIQKTFQFESFEKEIFELSEYCSSFQFENLYQYHQICSLIHSLLISFYQLPALIFRKNDLQNCFSSIEALEIFLNDHPNETIKSKLEPFFHLRVILLGAIDIISQGNTEFSQYIFYLDISSLQPPQIHLSFSLWSLESKDHISNDNQLILKIIANFFKTTLFNEPNKFHILSIHENLQRIRILFQKASIFLFHHRFSKKYLVSTKGFSSDSYLVFSYFNSRLDTMLLHFQTIPLEILELKLLTLSLFEQGLNEEANEIFQSIFKEFFEFQNIFSFFSKLHNFRILSITASFYLIFLCSTCF
jgi:hypothetical protein